MVETNDLKEIRKRNSLIQGQTAEILDISLRSYKDYENDPIKKDFLKYNAFLKILEDKFKIDEEHGVLYFTDIKETVTNILNQYDLNFCYLFGSYAKGKANENSDVDLLIDTTVDGLDFMV